MNTQSKKILIIDDELLFREIITDALSPCGYQCEYAQSPADGIIHLNRTPFDLVLLDIMMEPVDGWDTLSHIRALPNGTEIPVIMSSVKKPLVDEIIRYGDYLTGYFRKPFVDLELCESVADFFTWNEHLISGASSGRTHGVSVDICTRWIQINRQIRAFNQMIEVVSPWCIPKKNMSEEEYLAHRMMHVEMVVTEKTSERDLLCETYPDHFYL